MPRIREAGEPGGFRKKAGAAGDPEEGGSLGFKDP
jgi:hypothetical protein